MDVSDPSEVDDGSFTGSGILSAIGDLGTTAANAYLATKQSETQLQIAQLNAQTSQVSTLSYVLIAAAVVVIFLIK